MLEIMQYFAVDFIEMLIFIILWSEISFDENTRWNKNLLVAFIGSVIMISTSYIEIFMGV